MAVIETTSLISETMDNLIDFIVKDDFLGKEFEDYLIKNKIEIRKESELNVILIDYILEGKLKDGIRVLDYYASKNPSCDKKTVNALKESFVSIFKIEKIEKNSYKAFCIISEKSYTLIPLVKTVNLREIGLYDYIKARIIEIDNNFYLLEIFDCISAYKEYFANLEATRAIIRNPKIAVKNNIEKFMELKNSIASFHSSFLECFDKDEVIVSNKYADNLLDKFYLYHTGKTDKISSGEIKNDIEEYKYFDIEEFKSDNFLLNTKEGFSSSKENYDMGFYSDSDTGLFVIPFLGTLNEILSRNSIQNIEGAQNCIRYILTDDRIPPNLLRKKQNEYHNFIDIINLVCNKDFASIEDVIDFYKYDYKNNDKFSPLTVLYNSSAFSKVLGHKEKKEEKTVGRNDPCPCGSGKKYKKCCLNKGI